MDEWMVDMYLREAHEPIERTLFDDQVLDVLEACIEIPVLRERLEQKRKKKKRHLAKEHKRRKWRRRRRRRIGPCRTGTTRSREEGRCPRRRTCPRTGKGFGILLVLKKPCRKFFCRSRLNRPHAHEHGPRSSIEEGTAQP